MNKDRPESRRERLLELLAEQAAFGANPAENSERQHLLAEFSDIDPDEFERLAAVIDLTLSPPPVDPLPANLRALVGEQARRFFLESSQTKSGGRVVTVDSSRPRPWAWAGWLVAAACLVVAAAGWWNALAPRFPLDVARAREILLAEPGVVKAALERIDAPVSAQGDVVWSGTAQRGFLRLSGLPINDPRQQQYQLWIFDDHQDTRYPIDGGVFDIHRTGDVIVPIRAAILVADPMKFAITVERPGGVVVSSREQIVLLGSVSDGATN